MEGNNIVIVGNGFDMNHGLPSSYANFKSWLRQNDRPLYDLLERYIDVSGNWWNEFERNLSEFNVPRLIKETPLDNHPRASQILPSFSHPVTWRMDSIRENITKNFTEWIKTIDGMSTGRYINLPDAKLYITFNYTDVLERVYGISEDRIIYIHGKASRGDKLIYGHGKNHYLLERDVKERYGLYESNDFYKAGTFGDREYQLTIRISFLEKQPYNQLVRYSEVLIPAIERTEIVWVYGLSFSEVDFPYIDWIVKRNHSLRWHASWHTEEDKNRIQNTFETLRVKDYELFYL